MYATLANAKVAVVKMEMQVRLWRINEQDIILELYEKVKPYLTKDAIAEIERKGKYVYSKEFGWVTPTLPSDHEICVYGFREKNGTIKCAFEQAYYDGAIDWKKPLSCHLVSDRNQTG